MDDPAFTKALPKVELHAHLSGSISKTTLHDIWSRQLHTDLQDPLVALSSMPDIFTFFRIFDQYIYKLVNDEASIGQAVQSVIDDFEQDGVAYLELRTTPRAIGKDLDAKSYVRIVLDAIGKYVHRPTDRPAGIEVHLLLSIDRNMSLEQAAEVLSIAEHYKPGSEWHAQQVERCPHSMVPAVLGIDLCGNPMRGDVNLFTPIFLAAKQKGLRTTVHFAEVPASSTEPELLSILSWSPDRLGHVICVPEHIMKRLQESRIALELCLSCNVIAKMVQGSYADHHFGIWQRKTNPIALSTDDVGVFESSLSNEYCLAARYFNISRKGLVALSRRATLAAFAGRNRMTALLDRFEIEHAELLK